MEVIFSSFWNYIGTLVLIIVSGYSLAIAFYWLGMAISKSYSRAEKEESSSPPSNRFFSKKYGN